jgi:hypothetical protein
LLKGRESISSSNYDSDYYQSRVRSNYLDLPILKSDLEFLIKSIFVEYYRKRILINNEHVTNNEGSNCEASAKDIIQGRCEVVEMLDFLMGYESYLRKRQISVSSCATNLPENIVIR